MASHFTAANYLYYTLLFFSLQNVRFHFNLLKFSFGVNAMDSRRAFILRVSIANLCILVLASTLFPECDAINHGRAIEGHEIRRSSTIKSLKKLKSQNRLSKFSSFEYSDFDSYGSPSSLPLAPFNSLAPQPTPSTSGASPYPLLTPPSTPTGNNPSLPAYSPVPNPPHGGAFGPPSPSTISNSPPPSPPKHAPSPPKSVPSPPQMYLPPIVYPPPPSPSVHHKKPPQYALWCVAKPTVPDPIIQVAMDYACGSGADCKSIQPNGSCFQPNTLLAHASYAFNSYWQNTKNGGGTCDFGGTAMLVTVDPSYDKCNFMLT